MRNILGDLNQPSTGLAIHYGKATMIPNSHGGKTTFYDFEIYGEEAVGVKYIEFMLQAIVNCGGTIANLACLDVENNEAIELPIPVKQNHYVFQFDVVIDNASHHLPDGQNSFSNFHGLSTILNYEIERINKQRAAIDFQISNLRGNRA